MGIVLESALPRSEKYVLIALADHAKEDGADVYPSLARIEWKTGYSETQVRDIMRSLKNKKILLLVHRGGNGDGDTNKYRIDLKAIPMLMEFSEWVAQKREKQKKGTKTEPCEGTVSTPCEGTVSVVEGCGFAQNEGTKTEPEPRTIRTIPLEPGNRSLRSPAPMSQSVWLIAKKEFWAEVYRTAPQVGLYVPSVDANLLERFRAAASPAGMTLTQAKQAVSENPHYRNWPHIELIDSQAEIDFPEPEKPKPMEHIEFPPEFKADGLTWLRILSELDKKVTRLSYDTWFKPTRGIGIYRRVLYINVPCIEFREIGEKFGDLLQAAMDKVCGDQVIDIKFYTLQELDNHNWNEQRTA
jgi:hypothetical protein